LPPSTPAFPYEPPLAERSQFIEIGDPREFEPTVPFTFQEQARA
jgi:hypothetical protein